MNKDEIRELFDHPDYRYYDVEFDYDDTYYWINVSETQGGRIFLNVTVVKASHEDPETACIKMLLHDLIKSGLFHLKNIPVG